MGKPVKGRKEATIQRKISSQKDQDGRVLKRQRRIQSNRESAIRSLLRKKELAQRVEVLMEENSTLRSEMSRIRSENEQLLYQNVSLKPESPSPSLERAKMNSERKKDMTNSASLRKKMIKNPKSVPRRSQRIRTTPLSTQNQDVETLIENINIVESDKEDQQCFKEDKAPEKILEGSTEKKIDHLLLLLETQQKALEPLVSKETNKCVHDQITCLPDSRSEVKMLKYKGMYIDSQKKIDILREENYLLGKKLEFALGKLEAYEKGQHVFSGVMEKVKDAILVSNLTRTTETVAGLSPSQPRIALPEARNQAAKRKKRA